MTADCKVCQYRTPYGKLKCHHPSNTIRKQNWYMIWDVYKRKPEELNKDNCCDNFVREKD